MAIPLGLQGQVLELTLNFAPLPFDKAPQGGKELIGWGSARLRGGLLQRAGCLSDL